MNLNGLPIRGTNNYKGIVTLGTDITQGLGTTLKAVGDGMGGYSPLELSTTEVSIRTGVFNVDAQLRLQGTIYNTIDDIVRFGGAIRTATFASIGGIFTNAARLHVRGDGTNPIARFENNDGTNFIAANVSATRLQWNNYFYIETLSGNNNLVNTSNSTFTLQTGLDDFQTRIRFIPPGYNSLSIGMDFQSRNFVVTSGNNAGFYFNGRSFAADASGSGNFRGIQLDYTINNIGTQSGTATGIFLNSTETALSGMAHNLMDLQRAGASQFRIDRVGNLTLGWQINYGSNQEYIISSNNSGFTLFASNQGHTFGALDGTVYHKFTSVGYIIGTGASNTNAFPMLKRNSATLEVRLADDSGFANLNAAQIYGYTAGASPDVRYKLGAITGGQAVSTREGEFSIGLIDAGQNAGIRCLIRTSGVGYIDGYSEGTSKATNYRLVFGSRVNNTGADITNSTTQENGTPVIFGSDVHNDSAIVQINSTTRGFLPPRMAESERDAIPAPAEGLLIYNTTTQRINLYVTSWIAVH